MIHYTSADFEFIRMRAAKIAQEEHYAAMMAQASNPVPDPEPKPTAAVYDFEEIACNLADISENALETIEIDLPAPPPGFLRAFRPKTPMDAIAERRAQLRGDAPNGTLYEHGVLSHDKPRYRFAPLSSEPGVCGSFNVRLHTYDILTDACPACGYTHTEIADNLAPRECPGTRLIGEACIQCGAKAFVSLSDHGRLRHGRCLVCGHGSWADKRNAAFRPPPKPRSFWPDNFIVKAIMEVRRQIFEPPTTIAEKREKMAALDLASIAPKPIARSGDMVVKSADPLTAESLERMRAKLAMRAEIVENALMAKSAVIRSLLDAASMGNVWMRTPYAPDQDNAIRHGIVVDGA